MKKLVLPLVAAGLALTATPCLAASRDDNDGWVLDCARPGIFNAIVRGLMPFACK